MSSANSPISSDCQGWTLHEYDVVDSTNFVASKLPVWHAVRADTQTAGRGRFQRSWVSDSGGLWLSAVVPTNQETLPLVAGVAVVDALIQFGIDDVRLRWPNDIMVDDRKLAGMLIDTFSPKTAVVGIGLNISNQPGNHDPDLIGTTTRLANLILPTPSISDAAKAILIALRSAVEIFTSGGFESLRPRINQLWGRPRQVTVDLDGVHRTGLFTGVDDRGRLLLQDEFEKTISLEPHQVRLLRELS